MTTKHHKYTIKQSCTSSNNNYCTLMTTKSSSKTFLITFNNKRSHTMHILFAWTFKNYLCLTKHATVKLFCYAWCCF